MKSTAVIVSAHGKFSEGILSTVKMIAGEFSNVKNVNFLDGDTFETLDEQLKEAFDSFNEEYDHIIFITDLMGGTPFNRSVINYGQYENVRILSGLNFASLFTAITSEKEDIDALADEIIKAGKDSIVKYELLKNDEIEDDFEDGI